MRIFPDSSANDIREGRGIIPAAAAAAVSSLKAAAGKVKKMKDKTTVVKCKVSECVHFADELCTADTIKVKTQGGMLSDCSCCAETECSTFKKR